MFYSIVIPVYNRPDEVDELLESLLHQSYKQFEVIIVEDGSTIPCQKIIEKYHSALDIKYFFKPNSGPAASRNYGVERSAGEFLLFFDSDCIIPPGYMESVERELAEDEVDAFGGMDNADQSFTTIQKAINYSMTSFITTGGIRGGKKKMDKFYPRSFNLGVKKTVFNAIGGFSDMRFGEDVDFSIRIYNNGYKCRLFLDSWVYHKRRTDFRKFFKQVFNSGIARINLYEKYPQSLKLVHCLPAIFTAAFLLSFLYLILYLLFTFITPIPPVFNLIAWVLLFSFALFVTLLFLDSLVKVKNIKIAFLAVIASFVQITGYGSGFLWSWWKKNVLKEKKRIAFEKTFYE